MATTPPGPATHTPGPLTAHLAPVSAMDGSHTPSKGIHLGRERVKWSEEVWERIDRAVHHEFQRTCVAAKFLPHHRVDPHVTTVPQDEILSTINGSVFSLANILAFAPVGIVQGAAAPQLLPNIDEAATTRLVEIWVEFSLTPQQVEHENTFKSAHHKPPEEHAPEHHGQDHQPLDHGHHSHHKHHAYSTAVTLATRAANILSQAQDSILFQGQVATGGPQTQQPQYPANYAGPFFTSGLISNRGYPGDFGLLSIGPAAQNLNLPSSQVVAVPSFPPPAPTFAVQIITVSGATAATTFTLTEGANTTGPIAWSAVNNTLLGNIQAVLTAAPFNLALGSFAVTAGSLTNGIGTIQITFLGALAAAATAITAAVPPALPGTVTVGVPARYVENTVRAIDTAYSLLQAAGHYGPYAAVLHFYPFADSYSPLPTTLILPADRIHPLMKEGYFGTGSLPGIPSAVNPPAGLPAIFNATNPGTQSMGFVASIGGNAMDLVIGQDPITAFSQLDQNGNHLFRVLTRFALRLKDPSAIIRLEFQ
jgi:uncharacterized linocin/CFP29 family protein